MWRWIRSVAGLVGALVLWELASRNGVLDPSVVASPITLARRVVGLFGDPDFQSALLATLVAWLLALALTVLLAVPAGLLLGSIPAVRTATEVLVEMLRPIPAVALIPLCLVMLGAGAQTKIVLAVFAGVWPLMFNVLAAVRGTDPMWIDTARSMGSGRLAVMARVRLPAVVPFAVTGLRVAAPLELIVLVSTEYVAGEGYPGLGSYLSISADQTGDMTTLLAGAAIAGGLGTAMSLLILCLRARWHRQVTTSMTQTVTLTRRQSVVRFFQRWLSLVIWIAVWQVVTERLRSPFAPTPASIVNAAYHMWFTGSAHSLWLTPLVTDNIVVSLERVVYGWLIAVAAGVGIGLLLGSVTVLADLVEPLAAFIRTIPPVLMLPVLLAWVRIGTPLSVTIIALGAVWPILINTMDGVRSVDGTLVDTARAFHTVGWRRLLTVVLPAASPKILTGVRISLSLALILMIVSELIGADAGIGFQLVEAQSLFAFPQMWAWIILTGALGYLFNRLVQAASDRMLPWSIT
ncbi:MAG TPA: ABC transporter permease subunit [Pseudonocardiaceae bacterium]|nr:ABC transporter permease subunit [Pseudonocardiaceae bacterium]